MLKRPTYKSIKLAAETSDRTALDSSIEKYIYLLSLSRRELKQLDDRYLHSEGCALCKRYCDRSYNGRCPLNGEYCEGHCMKEWQHMVAAHDHFLYGDKQSYFSFRYFAAIILAKLINIREEE